MGARQHGAGVVPLARSTGNILVARRTHCCRSEPGTWDVFGGSAEHGDLSPLDTARREFYEETAYAGPIEIYPGPVVRRQRRVGVMFVGIVPFEFVPNLSVEHDDYLWVSPLALRVGAQLHWPLREFLVQKPEPGVLRGRALLEALCRARAS